MTDTNLFWPWLNYTKRCFTKTVNKDIFILKEWHIYFVNLKYLEVDFEFSPPIIIGKIKYGDAIW